MSLRASAVTVVIFLAALPALAATGINWFGNRDVTSGPGLDAGSVFRGMADVDGDGNADFCRFVGTQLVCATSNGTTFTDNAVKSPPMYDAGSDTFRGLADVDGDGKADFCRFLGSGAARRLSCGKSTGTTFGTDDVSSPAGYDAGNSKFRGLGDVDGDGKADFCRFLGPPAHQSLSCSRSNGTTFETRAVTGSSPGISAVSGFAALADVNGDGKADFCRLLSANLSCSLLNGTRFDRSNFNSSVEGAAPSFIALADVNGDRRADFCRSAATGNRLVCSLAGATDFVADSVSSAVPYELGGAPFQAMADVNGDRRADFARFVSAPNGPMLAAGLGARALVINTIPPTLGNETNQDSEPFLAIHPVATANMTVSAFLRNPAGGRSKAPILVSTDNGMTWGFRATVPSQVGTGDITLAFAQAGGTTTGPLYGGILRRPSGPEFYDNLLTDDFASQTPMTVQASRRKVDQPFVQAGRTSNDRLYVGLNDFANKPRTATVDVSTSGGASFTSVRLDQRNVATQRQDAPSIRPAYCAEDGIVYVGFMAWRSRIATNKYSTDVVVVRDDQGGRGPNPFMSLLGSDGKAGTLVASGVKVPFLNKPVLGFERIGSQLSVAADPSNCSKVYVAWGDRTGDDIYTLHVRRSTDGGATWSADLQTLHNATTPALAVTQRGVVGLLYQQLTADQRWITRIVQTKDAFANVAETILATTPSNVPQGNGLPYLGDYNHLIALDDEFRGVFSANNTPAASNFPTGALFQRGINADNGTLRKPDGTLVGISIDPFYFSIPAIR